MLNVTDLNVRTLEHNLRVEKANRFGLLLSSPCRDRRASTLGAVLGSFVARLSWTHSAHLNTAPDAGGSILPVGTRVRHLA